MYIAFSISLGCFESRVLEVVLENVIHDDGGSGRFALSTAILEKSLKSTKQLLTPESSQRMRRRHAILNAS